jgi:Uma2 family endonuclease
VLDVKARENIHCELVDGVLVEKPVAYEGSYLAVEVLSRGNTVAEMERKRREYFDAGVRLVWIVDPPARIVAVYFPGSEPVLPGFTLELATLFANLSR